MLLEVLYGPEVVAGLTDLDLLEQVVIESKNFLSDSTYAVLLSMFGIGPTHGKFVDQVPHWDYLKKVLLKNPDHISGEILRADVAK